MTTPAFLYHILFAAINWGHVCGVFVYKWGCLDRFEDVLLVKLTLPGRVAQSVTCPTADPGVASSIPAWSHTFVEIDHGIISTVIILPSAESFKKGCCQLQA